MKNVLTAILFLCFAFGFGQQSKSVKGSTPHGTPLIVDENLDYTQIFTSVQVPASPKGGLSDLKSRIATSLKLQKVTEKTLANIIAKFVVWDDGSIRDIKIVKEIPSDLGLGNEFVRLLSKSENWIPGSVNGISVKQIYTMQISVEIIPTEIKSKPIEELKKEEQPIMTENSIATPEKQAEPIGGITKFYKDLSSKIQVPEVEVSGIFRTKVKFMVNQEGVLSEFEVLEETPFDVGLGKNVIKYLKTIPNWISGEQNGRKVKTYFVLPVAFNIEAEMESDVKKID